MGLELGGRKHMGGAEGKRKLNTQLENWQFFPFSPLHRCAQKKCVTD